MDGDVIAPIGVAQNSPKPTQSCKWSAETQVLDFTLAHEREIVPLIADE